MVFVVLSMALTVYLEVTMKNDVSYGHPRPTSKDCRTFLQDLQGLFSYSLPGPTRKPPTNLVRSGDLHQKF